MGFLKRIKELRKNNEPVSIRPFGPDEEAWLAQSTEWFKTFYKDNIDKTGAIEFSRSDLEALDKSLAFLYAHIEGMQPSQISGFVICMGAVLGEIFRRSFGLEWCVCRLSDIDLDIMSLRAPGTRKLCHPIEMLQKRVKYRENAIMESLFASAQELFGKEES